MSMFEDLLIERSYSKGKLELDSIANEISNPGKFSLEKDGDIQRNVKTSHSLYESFIWGKNIIPKRMYVKKFTWTNRGREQAPMPPFNKSLGQLPGPNPKKESMNVSSIEIEHMGYEPTQFTHGSVVSTQTLETSKGATWYKSNWR